MAELKRQKQNANDELNKLIKTRDEYVLIHFLILILLNIFIFRKIVELENKLKTINLNKLEDSNKW